MRRYLVVANQTLGGEHLLERVRECLAEGECSFHVLVPATFTHEHAFHSEGEARAGARCRLETALARFREAGATADGEIGGINPLYSIEDVLRRGEFDEIILSTLPPGPSRWLRQDLPHFLLMLDGGFAFHAKFNGAVLTPLELRPRDYVRRPVHVGERLSPPGGAGRPGRGLRGRDGCRVSPRARRAPRRRVRTSGSRARRRPGPARTRASR